MFNINFHAVLQDTSILKRNKNVKIRKYKNTPNNMKQLQWRPRNADQTELQ